MNIEQSLVSKSATTSSIEAKNRNNSKSMMDLVFPLCDHSNSNVRFPKSITTIIALFFYIQSIIVTLWPYSKFYDGKDCRVYGIITSIFWLLDFTDQDKLIFINLLVTSIIASFIILVVIFEVFYYKFKRTFMGWSLYILKFNLDNLSPILFQPVATLISISFLKVTSEGGIYWAYLALGVLFYIATYSLFILDISLNSKSIILTNSPFPLENYLVISNFALLNSLTIIISSIARLFSDWADIIIILAHIALISILLYKTFFYPFYTLFDNSLLATVETVSIIMDIMYIVLFFLPNFPVNAPLIVLASLLVVIFPIYYFSFKKATKNIARKLNYKFAKINPNEQNDYFENLGLSSNGDKQTKYLIVGMAKMCDMFLDFSLIDYIVKQNPSDKVICSMAQKVAYFPSEVRKLNIFLKLILDKRDLNLPDRFMVYQINRIKVLRSSSVSSESNEQIFELHALNEQSEADIKAFWTLPKPNVSYCEIIGKNHNKNLLIWKQAIETFPNNAKISYEYSRYLTEIPTDFEEAIRQQQRGILIEGGRNFAQDVSFKSFVRMFPNYLLKEVMDEKGVLLKKKVQVAKNSTVSTTSNSSSIKFSDSSDGITIDAETEDVISRKIIRNARMRMALHRSIADRRLTTKTCFYIEAILVFLITTVLFVAFYFYVSDTFYIRSKVIDNQYDASNFRIIENIGIYTIWVRWARESGKMSLPDCIGDKEHIAEVDKDFRSFIDLNKPFEQQVMSYIGQARYALNHLLDSLSRLAADGADVYHMSSVLLDIIGRIRYCSNNSEIGEFPSTFKDKLIYMLYLNGIIAGYDKGDTIFQSNDFCDVFINVLDFVNDVTQIFLAFDDDSNKKGIELNDLLNIITYVSVPSIFLIITVPSTVLIIISVKTIQKILNLMSSLPQNVKEASQVSIRADKETEEVHTSEIKNKITSSVFYGLLYLLLGALISIITYLNIQECVQANILITRYNQWYFQSAVRSATTGEVILEISNVVVMDGSFEVSYTNRSSNLNIVKNDAKLIINANNKLLRGDNETIAYFGYDNYMDKIHFKEQCVLKETDNSTHDLYACASVIQQIAILRDFIDEISSNPEKFNGKIDDPITHNMFHLVVNHLWNILSIIDERFVLLVDYVYEDLMDDCLLFLIFSILISLLIGLFTYEYVSILDVSYACAISLIKHIPPVQLVASKDLMDFLLNRKRANEDKQMSISQIIIHNSADSIICTGTNGIIEIANPSVTKHIGYTQDQLLGQPITSFLTQEDAEKIKKQMELMLQGQSASQYQDHIVGITDSTENVYFDATLFGMKDESTREISSFIFILSDETLLLQKQKDAEEAKAKSEELLYQILPKNVVVRLNRGEKDISFTIPHASVIFLDIQRFSDYTASLTPQEIMGNLSTIFGAFDDNIAKYSSLIKIKLIGDDYMAAGGLFGRPEDSPVIHAEEIIKFGLDCLSNLDEINVKLNSSLEVRVGVNTGGPLIAGVLGTDKPVFDIIGDTINVAARLQTTDIAGNVQISQTTKEIVEGLFDIQERGEVFLKGKGKQMTYLISPEITHF